MIMNQ